MLNSWLQEYEKNCIIFMDMSGKELEECFDSYSKHKTNHYKLIQLDFYIKFIQGKIQYNLPQEVLNQKDMVLKKQNPTLKKQKLNNNN